LIIMNERTEGLPLGKLPTSLLERLLRSLPAPGPDIIKGPGIGQDAAVVDFAGLRLIFKTDPITFLSKDIFWYLINVNSNDIACMGGIPKYLLVTLLLPEGIKPAEVERLFEELKAACATINITLLGGHTEVAFGIERPLAVGFMIGTLEREPLGASNAKPGDAILLSKEIPIEAASIIARQLNENLGMDEETLKRAKSLIYDPGISILKEAWIAAELGATALHDPTEGGLATGLMELALASGCGIEVDMNRIPVLDIAEKMLIGLGIDPLGAISSGSLLACCPSENKDAIINAWRAAGIKGTVIGRVTESGLVLIRNGKREPLPEFSRDELARFLS
jgi:hydrogenase expression/formation protein HypE